MSMLEQDRIMSDDDLAILGMQFVAYVKPVSLEGATAYSVHAADGTEIAILYDRDIALATIRRHDMEPVCVH
ncbi:MAG: hypothetical protein ACI82H_001677 [Alphaproteobacteria bacterium]|jgi:hypothetical protein